MGVILASKIEKVTGKLKLAGEIVKFTQKHMPSINPKERFFGSK